MSRKLVVSFACAAALLVLRVDPAAAQLSSNEATVSLNAELPESLTVQVLPASVNFVLTSGSASNPGNVPVAVTTSWTLALTRSALAVYGYFSSSSVALQHTTPLSTFDIPSARVEVSVNGGGNQAFDQTVAFGAANAGRQLASQAINALTVVGQRTDNLALNINLTSYTLPADVYTGTLRLRAQATP
jgi:hypothetical protein